MSVVRPEFGPTLPELLAPRVRALPRAAQRRARRAGGASSSPALAYAVVHQRGGRRAPAGRRPLADRATTCSTRRRSQRVAPARAETLRLQTPAGPAAPQRFTVTPYTLPPYKGDATGILTLQSANMIDADARGRIPGFVWRGDGRVNYNRQPGYEILFQAKIDGRTTYGRRTILAAGRRHAPARGRRHLACSPRAPPRSRASTRSARRTARAEDRDPLVPLRHRAPVSDDGQVTFDDFARVDIRVGRIVEVEDFPEARQPAWKLRVDFGPEIGVKRSSAQITNYAREELEGRLVLAVVNFPPRQIGPVRSEVLVLGTYSADGVLLLAPEPQARARRPRRLSRRPARVGSAAGRDGAAGGRRRRGAAGRATGRCRRWAAGRRPAAASASGSRRRRRGRAGGGGGAVVGRRRRRPRASARRGRRRRPTTRCPAARPEASRCRTPAAGRPSRPRPRRRCARVPVAGGRAAAGGRRIGERVLGALSSRRRRFVAAPSASRRLLGHGGLAVGRRVGWRAGATAGWACEATTTGVVAPRRPRRVPRRVAAARGGGGGGPGRPRPRRR